MQQQIDIQKLERILVRHEQQITALSKALDEANTRYCALESFVLALPNLNEANREKAFLRLSQFRIRQLGPGFWPPAESAHRLLESLLSDAKVPVAPEESAA
jgi:hypothetical protein